MNMFFRKIKMRVLYNARHTYRELPDGSRMPWWEKRP